MMRMNTESSLRREFIISSHFLTSCLWFTSTRIEAQPELSTRQQQHRQSSRCPASVILQDCKTERTYKYNRTVTVQQYRYTSKYQHRTVLQYLYCIQQYHPPPGQLTHTESLLYHRGQVESDVSNRNFSLRNKRLVQIIMFGTCLLYTSPSPRDGLLSRMPSSA